MALQSCILMNLNGPFFPFFVTILYIIKTVSPRHRNPSRTCERGFIYLTPVVGKTTDVREFASIEPLLLAKIAWKTSKNERRVLSNPANIRGTRNLSTMIRNANPTTRMIFIRVILRKAKLRVTAHRCPNRAAPLLIQHYAMHTN
jgi:hypothetical protein